MKGLKPAREMHAESGGGFYKNFKLEKSGQSAVVRVLQPETEWHSFHIHQLWDNVTRKFLVKPTRCPSETAKRDPENCALCALGDQVQRQFKTYIPVVVRQAKDSVSEYVPEVSMIVYGAKGLNPVENVIEDLPDDVNITMLDIRIKRMGEDLATQYYWTAVGSPRALTDAECAMEVPDIEEAWPIATEVELDRTARTFAQTNNVQPIRSDTDNFGYVEDEIIPF